MSQEESTSRLYVLITFLIVLVVGALLYFGGVFGDRKTEAVIDGNKPGVILNITR